MAYDPFGVLGTPTQEQSKEEPPGKPKPKKAEKYDPFNVLPSTKPPHTTQKPRKKEIKEEPRIDTQPKTKPLKYDPYDIYTDALADWSTDDDLVSPGKALVGLGEHTLSVASSAVLYPFSKVFGAVALFESADEAYKVENMVMNLAYPGFTEVGKGLNEGLGYGMEKLLWPAHKVGEGFKILSDKADTPLGKDVWSRVGWLAQTGIELAEFKILGELAGIVKGEIGRANAEYAFKELPPDLQAEVISKVKEMTMQDLETALETADLGDIKILDPTERGARGTSGDFSPEEAKMQGRGRQLEVYHAKKPGADPVVAKNAREIRYWEDEADLSRGDNKHTVVVERGTGPGGSDIIVRHGDAVNPENFKIPEKAAVAEEIVTQKKEAAREATVDDKKRLIKASNEGFDIKDLLLDRQSSIKNALIDSEIYIQTLERLHSPDKLEALPFIVQKLADPALVNILVERGIISQQTGGHIMRPGKELLNTAENIRKYLNKSHEFLREHHNDVGYKENYIPQLWDIPKKSTGKIGGWFTTNNPHLKKSTIPSLIEGIKAGLKPKTVNIAEILRTYDAYKIRTAYNAKFAKSLSRILAEDGKPMIRRAIDAPEGWKILDHHSLNRAVYTKAVDGKPLLIKQPVKVHPEIYADLKNIFDSKMDFRGVATYEAINSVVKKSMLSLSLFHHLALTEAALASGIGREAFKMWNPKRIIRELGKGNYSYMENLPLLKDAIKHGLTVDPLPDYHVKKIDGYMRGVEAKLKGRGKLGEAGRKVVGGARKANALWDRALWDYYHTTLKVKAYEAQVGREMKRLAAKEGRAPTLEEIRTIKKEIAEFVNDSFGGQNWELQGVLGNPKIQQMMQWAFLAPDWMISTIKQGLAPARGMKRTGGKKHLARTGAKFWAKAILYYNLVAQSANYENTRRKYGEGRFTWQNPEGHYLDIFMGHNPDGTERYMRLGKQLRELPEWILESRKKFFGKLSPVLNETLTQIFEYDLGSMYPTELSELEGVKKIGERLKRIAEVPLPFSIKPYIENRPGSWLWSIPTSKGMTRYGAIKQMERALRKGDLMHLKTLYVQALQNGLNAEKSVQLAQAKVTSKINYDNRTLAREIFNEMMELPPEKRGDLIRYYVRKGILTPAVQEEFGKEIMNQLDIKEQQQVLGIQGRL